MPSSTSEADHKKPPPLTHIYIYTRTSHARHSHPPTSPLPHGVVCNCTVCMYNPSTLDSLRLFSNILAQAHSVAHTSLVSLSLSLSLSLLLLCSIVMATQRALPSSVSCVTERVSGRGGLGSATQGARSLPDHQKRERQADRQTDMRHCSLLPSVFRDFKSSLAKHG